MIFAHIASNALLAVRPRHCLGLPASVSGVHKDVECPVCMIYFYENEPPHSPVGAETKTARPLRQC